MTGERAALNILLKVTREDAYLNLALKDGLLGVDTASVPRITALVYTAIEKIAFCDYYIDKYAKGRVHSSIRGILRLSLTELFFMDTPDHAVCSKYVSLTEEIGKGKLKGFVNGVLRNIARDRKSGNLPGLPENFSERMNVLTGYPVFMINEYSERYGEEFTEQLLTASVRGTGIRPVYPKSREEIKPLLEQEGFAVSESKIVKGALKADTLNGSIAESELFKCGSITIQSEGAMLACVLLDPKPGMNVLDLCAAPGGKTAYIWDLAERKGSVIAWDIHEHRVELIRKTLSRLGCLGVKCAVKDATVFDESLYESFDRILCDVPCSGLGGGSKPDARLRRTEESVSELSKIQYSILDNCSKYLKSDGLLVYSTCTLSHRENESVVDRFLKTHPGFEPAPFGELIPNHLKERSVDGSLTLFPNLDDTEGFFIARLKRKV